jgi:hypothetical protein
VPKLSEVNFTVNTGDEVVHVPSVDPLMEASSDEEVDGPSNNSTKS